MKWSKELFVIFIIQVTEVLGFSLILPFLPFYAQELGASAFQVGMILTLFSVFQFFSAPIMGRLSDHYGRRPLLIISQLSTALGFLVLGLANTLFLVYLARVIDGLFGSNYTIAQAYLSDISTKKNRSKFFGLSGVAFGVGFLIGPAIGGYLSSFSYGLPSFISAGLALVSVMMTYFLLPETVKNPSKEINIKIIDFGAFKKFLFGKKTSGKLTEWFLYLMTHTLWVSMFALFAERQFGFGAREVGFLLAYIGLIAILLRGPLLPRLIDRFGEGKLEVFGVGMLVTSLAIAGFLPKVWMFYLDSALFSIGTGLIRPVLRGEISRRGHGHEQGALLGVADSLASISQIVAPLLGGFAIQHFPTFVLGLMAALFAAGMFRFANSKA